jgi:hypothetical protein
MKPNKTLLGMAAMLLCASASQAIVSPPLFTFSSGTRAASAGFSQSGGNLVVTLTNTFAGDALAPTDILTAVFFDISGGVTLTPVSANLNAGSIIQNAALCDTGGGPSALNCPGPGVGGEWAYAAGLTPGGPITATKGISSTGLGLFGPTDRFPGANLDGPDSVDGVQFGITTAGDNAATSNGGITVPLIKNSVVFTLSGLGAGPYTISKVFFLYGTSIGGEEGVGCPNGTCGGPGQEIPEPGYLLTLALLGVPVALRYRKTRQLNA